MARLLIFLVIVVLIQYLLAWALTHYGFILLGACSWWMLHFLGAIRARRVSTAVSNV
jgi:hypothetical protein